MENSEYNSPVVQVDRGRKHRQHHQRTKTSKYTSEGKGDPDLNCDHHLDKKSSFCQASKLTLDDMRGNNFLFYF